MISGSEVRFMCNITACMVGEPRDEASVKIDEADE
jgi:hypothetical protein